MNSQRQTLSRTGARRSGDDYQDLVLIDLLVDWLGHSTRYSWVKVEADDAGALDDVIALRSDNRLEAIQVKYAVHPDDASDAWTWEALLEQKTKRSKSLLQKWSQSIAGLIAQDREFNAVVISNRRASDELELLLTADGLVDFERMRHSAYFEEIVSQIGNEIDAQRFFSNISFRLNEPNLVELESGIYRLFQRLGGTEDGWLNLKNEVRLWIRDRSQPNSDGRITLADVRRAAKWHVLRPLPQLFEIPDDYVVPSSEFDRNLRKTLLETNSQCVVLTATPGTGKSTYASYLYAALIDEGVPVVRHHYFLSTIDVFTNERLSHERAAESLLHDLSRDHGEAMGDDADRNPQFNNLRHYLERVGNYYHAKNQKLIIIIDGLDHVWREHHSVLELQKLLEYLIPLPSGIVLLLVTQPIELIPRLVLRPAPKDTWHWLPSLSEEAIEQWLLRHISVLPRLDSGEVHPHVFREIVSAFFNKSNGHPLYLKYALGYLKLRTLPISIPAIESLPACPDSNINEYYEELWTSLSEQSKSILHLIATCSFSWPKAGILACLGTELTVALPAFNEVEHLLVQDSLGWRPFHSSMRVFVQETPDHTHYARIQIRSALDWMKTANAPEYLAWSHGWLLEADLGNTEPLLSGPSRSWAVAAFAARRSRQSMKEILTRSLDLALVRQDFPRAVELALLNDYCFNHNNYRFDSPVYNILLRPQLIVADDPVLFIRLFSELRELNDHELAQLAEAALDHSDSRKLVEECINVLFENIRARPHSASHNTSESVFPVLEAMALDAGTDPRNVLSWILDNREVGISTEMLITYCQSLRAHKNARAFHRIFEIIAQNEDLRVETVEHQAVIEQLVLLSFDIGIDVTQYIDQSTSNSPFTELYRYVRHRGTESVPNFEKPDFRWLNLKSYEYDEHSPPLWKTYHDVFFRLLINSICGRTDINREWLSKINTETWQHLFLNHLGDLANSVAHKILMSGDFSLSWYYELLEKLPKPNFFFSHDSYAHAHAATEAATVIGMDLLSVFSGLGQAAVIAVSDIKRILSSPYCIPFQWIERYLDYRRQWLDSEALSWLLVSSRADLESRIDEFYERAEQFGQLAALAAVHNRIDESREFISLAAENIVTHGNHKDMLFFGALESLVNYHEAIGKVDNANSEVATWLLKLVPAISSVREYTDGDETGVLPRELADALLVVAPRLLPSYYMWLAMGEQFNNADYAFNVFVGNCDLANEVSRAIATTAVDGEAYRKLVGREQRGDTVAAEVLSEARRYFGVREYLADKDELLGNSRREQWLRPEPPNVSDFDPAQLRGYLEALKNARIYGDDDKIAEWAEYWISNSSRSQVFEALSQAWNDGSWVGSIDYIYFMVRDLYGENDAYVWLVRAQSEDYGWNRYFAPADQARQRWEIVQREYGDRWRDFISDTFSVKIPGRYQQVFSPRAFVRLVEYCIYMQDLLLARDLVERIVEQSITYVSPLVLPIPTWLPNQ